MSLIEINVETLRQLLLEKADFQLVDVREETENRSVPFNAMQIPLSILTEQVSQIPKNKDVILFCQRGRRSLHAANLLRDHFQFTRVYSLKGGMEEFLKNFN